VPFARLLWGDGESWLGPLSALFTEGRMAAMEAALRTKNGEALPVLFAASWLGGEDHPGIVCVAQDISDWKQTQEQLRHKQQELEILTERLIAAQEDERARLARELHDDLTQRLAAVAIDAGRLERLLSSSDVRTRDLLQRIRREMADLSRDIHGLSRRLHPSTLDDLGLVAAIESESRVFFDRGGPPVDVAASGSFDDLPKGNQVALYRIVQEALRNIYKHSGADEVRIRLSREGGNVRLSIADNGRGFDDRSPASNGGIGLASMEERVRLMGGRIEIRSAPGQGTTIVIAVPAGAEHETAVDSAR
jgi:signal transduction histidine kinase